MWIKSILYRLVGGKVRVLWCEGKRDGLLQSVFLLVSGVSSILLGSGWFQTGPCSVAQAPVTPPLLSQPSNIAGAAGVCHCIWLAHL